MATEDLTAGETLVLLTLMAESRPVTNTELKKLGPELRPESRRKLNRLKLVDTDTGTRPYTHELADNGWARCFEELGAEAPPKAGPAGRTLYTLLASFQRYFARTGLRPADVFLPRSEEGAVTSGENPSAAGLYETVPLEGRVRAAYSQLAARPGGWVGLADLREVLADVSKDDLDPELVRMYGLPDVILVPEENQKTLTERDRAAAVVIGYQNTHVIAIEAQ